MNTAARSTGWGLLGHLAIPVSTGVLLLGLPFFLDPETYGYWQLYLFYALWLGYVTYGVPDGHHLRYAGEGLGALDRRQFAGKVLLLLGGVAAAMVLLAVIGALVAEDRTQALMWVLACASTALFVPRTLLTAALQSASRFGPFAAIMFSERGLVVALTLVALAVVGVDPVGLATADVLAKALGFFVALLVLRRLLHAAQQADPDPHAHRRLPQEPTTAPHQPASAWADTRADASVGILLVLANLAAVAAPGVLRLAVERRWGTVEFGQVSLAFSAALLLVTVAHSTGWIALPRLARIAPEQRPEVHRLVRDGLRGPLAAVVLLYLPAEALLTRVLPDYGTAWLYMGLLLPLVVVEARWRVVTMGLLKVMRRQRLILALNLVALGVAVVLALWFTLVVPSPVGVVVSLLATTVLRSLLGDVWLARQLGQEWLGALLLDLVVVGALVAAMVVGGLPGAALGLAVVAVATWWHRGTTAEMLVRVRQEVTR